MSAVQNTNPWKWSSVILAILLISCIGWYFLKGNEFKISEKIGIVSREDVIMPEHVTEANQDYADFVVRQEEFKASKDPIRKSSTVNKGDSFYQILLQNSISHTQAYEILKEVKGVFDLSRV
ncbi:MAG TPA: hypothetical protein PLA18_03085, partial [Deltaproteobacteria bacterium]|nr:hypothetical protein [Deltaproteobacteria bacterium]